MGSLTFWRGARPSFAGGIASIADLGNTLTEYSSINADIYDAFQLALDWRMVGEDMRKVLKCHAQEVERTRPRVAVGAV